MIRWFFLSGLSLLLFLFEPGVGAALLSDKKGAPIEWGYGGVSFGLQESGPSRIHYWDAFWKHNNELGRFLLVHKRFRMKYEDQILTDQEGVSFVARIKRDSWSLFFGDLYYREWRRDNLRLPLFGVGIEFRPLPSWNFKAYGLSGRYRGYVKKAKGLFPRHRSFVASDLLPVNGASSEELSPYSGVLLGHSWRYQASGMVYNWHTHALIRHDDSRSHGAGSFVPLWQWGLMRASVLSPLQRGKEASINKGFYNNSRWGDLFPGPRGAYVSGAWSGDRNFSWNSIGYADGRVRWSNAIAWAYREKPVQSPWTDEVRDLWRGTKKSNQTKMSGRKRTGYRLPDGPISEAAVGGLLPLYLVPLHVHFEYLDSAVVKQKRYGLWLHRAWDKGRMALGWSYTKDFWQGKGTTFCQGGSGAEGFGAKKEGGLRYQQMAVVAQHRWGRLHLSTQAALPFLVQGSWPEPLHDLALKSSQGLQQFFFATRLRFFLYQSDSGSSIYFISGFAYSQSSPLDPMTRWGLTPRYLWLSRYGYRPWWFRLSWQNDWGELFVMWRGYGKGDYKESQFQWSLEVKL